MQKVINALAVLSFLGTASIVGGGAYVYLNREAIAEDAKEKVTKAATEAIAGALPDMLGNTAPLGESGPVGGSSLPIQFP